MTESKKVTGGPRVLMAVPQYPYPVIGGLERQCHELAKALLRLGVNVQALSGRIIADQPERETVEGVLVYRIPWPRRKLLRFLRAPFDLFAVLYRQRNAYDVIHLHQFSGFGAFVILAARLLRKPIMTKLPSIGATSLPGIARSSLGAIRLATFRLTDAVVAMSAESVAELDAVGFPLERVLRTPNGIRILPPARPSISRDSPGGPCRVVFVGRLSQEKLIADLLHAWHRVVRSIAVPAILELWGRGPAEAEMKDLCASLGITESVLFRGHVDSVREGLEYMDIFVLTSTREGNSNAILEAMAAGLPVVSTRVGGTPMQVGADGAPLLVEPGDTDGLTARLVTLIEDAGLRRTFGAAMRKRIADYFDMDLVARTYLEAYKLLASNRRDEMFRIGNPIIGYDQKNPG